MRKPITFVYVILLHLVSADFESGGKLRIQPFHFPESVQVGRKVVVGCFTTFLTSHLEFEWLKDGRHITTENNIKIVTLDDVSNLVINPVSLDGDGNYTCILRDGNEKDEYSALLQVHVPPSWIVTPKDQETFLGSNMTLTCRAKGKPTPTIKWKFLLSNGEKRDVQSDASGTMTIHRVTKSDEGQYQCEADNKVGGKSISKSIFLAVIVPARFENKFSMETVRRGDSATLRCPAKGDDPIAITWQKDKHDIANERRYEKFETKEEDGLNSEVFIRNVERIDGALYTCTAKNNYGTDDRNIKVVVVEVPAPILDARVQEVWSRSVNLAWSSPYSGNSPIIKYIIQYWRDRGAPHKLLEHEVAATQTSAVLSKNLEPGTRYAVIVIAENEVGQGEPSKEVQFVTGEEEPSGPPTDITVEAKGAASLLIKWKPPPREFWNGELKGYYIGYKVDRSSQPHSYKTMDRPTNNTMEFLLQNLVRATRYSLLVKAFNGAGTGPQSQEIVVKTLEGELPKAPSVSLVSSSPSAISLKWDKSGVSANDVVSGITLHYQREALDNEWTHVPLLLSVEVNRYTITGLQSGTNYKLYLTASNKFGRGDPSDTMTIKTDDIGMKLKLPFNVDLGLIIPVATGLVAFLVIVIVVAIYLRKAKIRREHEKSKMEKQSQYSGTTQRYIDMEKARPMLVNPDQGSEAYDFIPSRNDTIDSRYSKREMKTFIEEQKKCSYSRPNSLKKGGFGGVYESAQ